MSQTIAAIIFLVIGILSLIYNKPSADKYAQTWGQGLKHGYEVGRFISIFGGMLFALIGLLIMFVNR